MMDPNFEKSKVMHVGSAPSLDGKRAYVLTRKNSLVAKLAVTSEERDLGIILTPDFKFSAQAALAASKANSILAILQRTFLSRDVETWTSLNRAYIRPHLEFANSAWNSFLK